MAKKASKVAADAEPEKPTKKVAAKKPAAAKPVKAVAAEKATVLEAPAPLVAAKKVAVKKTKESTPLEDAPTAPSAKAKPAKSKASVKKAPEVKASEATLDVPVVKIAPKKKATVKKAAQTEMPELFETAKVTAPEAPALVVPAEIPTAVAKSKTVAKKKPGKAAKPEPEPVVAAKAPQSEPVPESIPEAPISQPAPVAETAVAPAAPPAQILPPSSIGAQPQKPRPLYVPREVEAFLRAAGLPIPSENAQLDAIMAAMNAAKMAAQQAIGRPAQGGNPTQSPEGEAAQPSQAQNVAQQQPSQQSGQHGGQPRLSREERRQQHMQMRQQQRDQRRQQHQQNQQNQQTSGDGQPQQAAGGDRSQQQGQQPRPPRVEEPVELVEAEGYCEISGKGFGFIRDAKRHFQPNPMDVFVTPEIVKRFGVKDGHWLKVEARKNSRGMQINKLLEVNGQPPENVKMWPSFEDLTTISPIEHIKLETVPERTTTRIIDLLTPIGKGQRGLIVAPPRTGKTTLLNHMADAVVKNHPDMHLMILLVDERPEEVTDFRRNVPQAELWASSNDMDVKSHTRIATLAIERARRLVESGKDVFLLLDSITRLGRAFNNAISGGGRTMSGGVDSRALENPRKFFAAARNTEEAGSLTIVATALIDTGSRMDDLIFQEFKGTGNSEVVLDRKISDMRIYPAIDIFQSGTRREELILPADQLNKINVIRRGLVGHKPIEAIERVLSFVKRFPTNEALLREIPG
jgi:transcription termination factor Rho